MKADVALRVSVGDLAGAVSAHRSALERFADGIDTFLDRRGLAAVGGPRGTSMHDYLAAPGLRERPPGVVGAAVEQLGVVLADSESIRLSNDALEAARGDFSERLGIFMNQTGASSEAKTRVNAEVAFGRHDGWHTYDDVRRIVGRQRVGRKVVRHPSADASTPLQWFTLGKMRRGTSLVIGPGPSWKEARSSTLEQAMATWFGELTADLRGATSTPGRLKIARSLRRDNSRVAWVPYAPEHRVGLQHARGAARALLDDQRAWRPPAIEGVVRLLEVSGVRDDSWKAVAAAADQRRATRLAEDSQAVTATRQAWTELHGDLRRISERLDAELA